MKILIISFFFPPYNSIGAVRVGKTAKYLHESGHDVRVVTVRNAEMGKNLSLEVPEENVLYTNWVNVDRPFNILSKLKRGKSQRAETDGVLRGFDLSEKRVSLRNFLKNVYHIVYEMHSKLIAFPDREIGWLPYALRGASQCIRSWQPDLIYASGLPPTSLLVGSLLSRKYKVPWVAELRDLWTDNDYYFHSGIRRHLEQRLERVVLSSAVGIVTVSQPLADNIYSKFKISTKVIQNGFDADDYSRVKVSKEFSKYVDIAYTGNVYYGKQDPSPLFKAIQLLGEESKWIRVHFYGKNPDFLRKLAIDQGVSSVVYFHDIVSYAESIEIQCEADVLLLLTWNDPRGRGVFSGKLFEYIGANRPILAIGTADTVATDLIRERDAGVVLSEVDKISAQLRSWIQEKKEQGGICQLSCKTTDLTREYQTKKLIEFFKTILPLSETC